MRFSEMIKISDMKDTLADNRRSLAKLEDNIHLTITQKSKMLIESNKNDFISFFKPLGFQIGISDNQLEAIYKTVYIRLKKLEPGRRKDDIPCFFRYQLLIHSEIDDIYEIYVQSSNSLALDDINAQLRVSDSSIFEHIIALKNNNLQLLKEIERLKSKYIHSPHGPLLDQLSDACLTIKDRLEFRMIQLAALEKQLVQYCLISIPSSSQKDVVHNIYRTFLDVFYVLDNPLSEKSSSELSE